MENTLTLVFVTETGEKYNFSISDVKEDISEEEVNELMDTIVTNDVFATKKGRLMSKYSAYVTAREVTKFEIA